MPEAVIVSALRAPLGTAVKGTLRETTAFDLAHHVVEATTKQLETDASVDDLILGEGRFADEVVPIDTPFGQFAVDEHPRRTTALEKLASLKVLHPEIEGFSITAGNAAGANDGAALLTIASDELGLPAPIHTAVATTGTGIPELVAAIDDHHRAETAERRAARARAQILSLAHSRLRSHPGLDTLAAEVAAGRRDPYTAAELLAP